MTAVGATELSEEKNKVYTLPSHLLIRSVSINLHLLSLLTKYCHVTTFIFKRPYVALRKRGFKQNITNYSYLGRNLLFYTPLSQTQALVSAKLVFTKLETV